MTSRTRLLILGFVFTLLMQIPHIVFAQQNSNGNFQKIYKTGDRDITHSYPFGDKLILLLEGLTDYELMVTDGTPNGTKSLGIFEEFTYQYTIPERHYPPVANGYLYFAAKTDPDNNKSAKVWKTDGTVEGTQLAASPGESPENFRGFDDKIFFYGFFNGMYSLDENDQLETYSDVDVSGVWNNEMYVYKTYPNRGIYKLDVDSKSYSHIADFEDLRYFNASSLGLFVVGWQSDNNVFGTTLYIIDDTETLRPIKSFSPGTLDVTDGGIPATNILHEGLRFIHESDGRVYFVVYYEDKTELWSTDGTETGTQLHHTSDQLQGINNLITHNGSIYVTEKLDLNGDGFFAEGYFLMELNTEEGQVSPVMWEGRHIVVKEHTPVNEGFIKRDSSIIFRARFYEENYNPEIANQIVELNTTTSEVQVIVDDNQDLNSLTNVTNLNMAGDNLYFLGRDPDSESLYHTDLFVINSSNFGNEPSDDEEPTDEPAVVNLASPADTSTGISRTPTLLWDKAENALSYRLQLGTGLETITDSTVADTLFNINNQLEENTQYFWRVKSLKDELESDWSQTWSFTTKEAVTDTAEVTPTEVAAEFSLSFGESFTPQDYRLIALPGQVDESLKLLLSGSQDINWQAYWDDGTDEDYLIKYDGSQTFSMAPGNGFWVISTDSIIFSDTLDVVELNEQNQAVIPLHGGWNIISNPLNVDVPWSTVVTANGDSLQPVWGFEGVFEEVTDFISAKTGQAFYFLNDQGLEELVIPYEESSVKGKDKEIEELILTTHVDGSQASSSRIVFVDRKTKTHVDVVAPPSGFEGPALRFTAKKPGSKRGNTLARIYRTTDPQGQSFDVKLNATPGEPVTFKLHGWDHSISAEAVLVDQLTGKTYDLTLRDGIPFTPEKETTLFAFVMGGRPYLESEQDQFLPKQISVLPNYPNPFNPSTTIRFALPKQAEVRVQIYDILGRRVNTLVNGVREAGIHTATFDASRQASGMYFAIFEVGSKRFVQKMLLIK